MLLWMALGWLCSILPAFGAPFREKLPQLVRLTGAFSAAVQDTDERPYLLEISIAGKLRPFYVYEARSLTSDDWGTQILRNVGALLVLTGPPELLGRLINVHEQLAWVQLEGRLYIDDRTLALSSVRVE